MKFNHILFIILLSLGYCIPIQAQKVIRVTGTVYNTANKKKVPFTDSVVQIYSCKTIGEAEDLQKMLDADNVDFTLLFDEESIVETDQNGYYDILVPDNGALVFKAGMNKSVLERVKNRMQIDIGIDDGIRIDEVVVTGVLTEIKPEPKNSHLVGNRFYPYNSFVIPEHAGNNHSRLIIQPYVLNCENDDTIAFCKPLIYDGKEYHLTQHRLKGYDISRDPLAKWVKKQPLTQDKFEIEWTDTIIVPDPNSHYSCYADFIIEDYRSIRYQKSFQVNTCNNKSPMRFLQYSLVYKDLDFQKYKERAQVEKRNSADKVSLTFEINSAHLTDDPSNSENLSKIKDRLNEIVHAPGATLKEFHITGTSSPEGSYENNLHLAEKRMKQIQKEVTAVLPGHILARVYQNPQAKVAPWSEVTRLLKENNHLTEAAQIEEILNKYKTADRQSIAIRRLPSYQEVITPYLNLLRQVEYRCIYDIYREPTDEEVLEEYQKHGLKMEYTRYEYWKLLQMLKEDKEVELLAKKAYEESRKMNPKRPWILPANILATHYLKRDTFDTKILEPLIDKSIHTVNYERRNIDTRRVEVINPEEVIINQLCMYIKAGDFEQASIMAKILPEKEEYKLIKAFTWALGGYFHGGNTPEEKERANTTFELVKNSTPRNAVIINLALETKYGNQKALEALKDLPEDDAMTWYLRATIAARKGDSGFSDAMMALMQCFQLDKSYIPIAKNDGEFNKELIESTLEMMVF